jgi:hypothetical protein
VGRGTEEEHVVMVTRHPTGQDLICLVCGKQAQDIDHVVNRGSGGSKERDIPTNKVPLCRECHDLKTVGRIETRIRAGEFEDGYRWFTYSWNRTGSSVEITIAVEVSQRYKCLVKSDSVLSDGAEAAEGSGAQAGSEDGGLKGAAFESPVPPVSTKASSAPSPSAGSKEESDGMGDDGLGVHGSGSRGDISGGGVGEPTETSPPNKPPATSRDSAPNDSQHRPVLHSDGSLTHEQRVAIAQEIKNAQQRRQFLAGDTANAWDEELNEDFWNLYANEFGYTYPSLRNVMRVCKRIPPDQRHDEMSFGHHEAVKTFDIETRDAWLERAFGEEWPVKRLREELVAEGLLKAKAKTRKWALEQLREAAKEWGANGPVQEFLEWLQQRS